jgi:hypothetical protein
MGTPMLYEQEPEQHMVALMEANRVRMYRARLKASIRGGECPWHVVLWDPDCGTMMLSDALGARRQWGAARVRRVMSRLHLSARIQVGALTDRQKRELVGTVA